MRCACDHLDWCDYHAPMREQRDALLAALKAMVADYELLIGDGLTDSGAPPLLKEARALIAQAECR